MLRIGIFILTAFACAAAAQAETATGISIGLRIGRHTTAAVRRNLTYTWGAAEISVWRAGYHVLARQAAVDQVYWFTALSHGRPFRVGVAQATGRVVQVISA